MNLRFFASTMVVVAVAACGGKKDESNGRGGGTGVATGGGGGGTTAGGGAKGKWLAAAWKPTAVEVGDVKVKVDVPDGLPANDEYMLGKDWWVGVGVDITKGGFPGGPRLTLDRPRTETYADAEALARDVEPDAKRLDLIEIAKESLPGGRMRFVSATNGNRHLDVTVWIPLADPTKGVRCNAHWYAGSGETPANPPPPDTAIIDWLKKFCDSAQVTEAAAAPPPPAPPQ
ncbi:MAG TPA: hypothetical protein VM261_16100 [Kofleriaceae bacterium]|nr:hypothetical protein [Kofleriaceae bacterium]